VRLLSKVCTQFCRVVQVMDAQRKLVDFFFQEQGCMNDHRIDWYCRVIEKGIKELGNIQTSGKDLESKRLYELGLD
jgi:hypothetical protein